MGSGLRIKVEVEVGLRPGRGIGLRVRLGAQRTPREGKAQALKPAGD